MGGLIKALVATTGSVFLKRIAGAGAFYVGAVVLGLIGVIFVLVSIFEALAPVMGPAITALVMAIVLLVVAAVLVFVANGIVKDAREKAAAAVSTAPLAVAVAVPAMIASWKRAPALIGVAVLGTGLVMGRRPLLGLMRRSRRTL